MQRSVLMLQFQTGWHSIPFFMLLQTLLGVNDTLFYTQNNGVEVGIVADSHLLGSEFASQPAGRIGWLKLISKKHERIKKQHYVA